jgi:hypothetical protein
MHGRQHRRTGRSPSPPVCTALHSLTQPRLATPGPCVGFVPRRLTRSFSRLLDPRSVYLGPSIWRPSCDMLPPPLSPPKGAVAIGRAGPVDATSLAQKRRARPPREHRVAALHCGLPSLLASGAAGMPTATGGFSHQFIIPGALPIYPCVAAAPLRRGIVILFSLQCTPICRSSIRPAYIAPPRRAGSATHLPRMERPSPSPCSTRQSRSGSSPVATSGLGAVSCNRSSCGDAHAPAGRRAAVIPTGLP